MLSYLLLGIAFLTTGTAGGRPMLNVSVCDLVQRPAFYNGKMVRVRGKYVPGPADSIFDECHGPSPQGATLVFTNEIGVLIKPPVPFKTRYDHDMKKFLYYLNARRKVKNPPGVVAAPWANRKYCLVTVTVTGRFDAVSKEDASWGRGYGEAGEYPYRIVVESVSNPVAKECPESSPSSK